MAQDKPKHTFKLDDIVRVDFTESPHHRRTGIINYVNDKDRIYGVTFSTDPKDYGLFFNWKLEFMSTVDIDNSKDLYDWLNE